MNQLRKKPSGVIGDVGILQGILLSGEGEELIMQRNEESEDVYVWDTTSEVDDGYTNIDINWALFVDALQHPPVMLPLTVCLLSALNLLLLWPGIGGRALNAALVLFAGAAALSNLALSYFSDFDQKYSKKARELFPLSSTDGDSEAAQIGYLRDTLGIGFAQIESDEGVKALDQLNQVYDGLRAVLDHKVKTDAMSMARIPSLAAETYRQGLSILSNALDLMATIHSTTDGRLEEEIRQLEKDIESAKADESQKERLKIWRETIASHRERLDLVAEQQLRIEQLLHQAQTCEASLHRTRIEVSALRADPAESSVHQVTQTLRKTIDQAKDVQEEITRHRY
jgi:hypothetical protein